MPLRLVLAAVLLATSPALVQKAKKAPREAAADFSLDPAALRADGTATEPAVPAVDGPPADASTPDPVRAEPATEPPAPSETTAGALTLDTPIAQLVADAHGRAVLDRDMPGLSTDANLPKFEKLSLRKFQPLTGGQLTDELLGRIERDLATPPAKPTKSRHTER